MVDLFPQVIGNVDGTRRRIVLFFFPPLPCKCAMFVMTHPTVMVTFCIFVTPCIRFVLGSCVCGSAWDRRIYRTQLAPGVAQSAIPEAAGWGR